VNWHEQVVAFAAFSVAPFSSAAREKDPFKAPTSILRSSFSSASHRNISWDHLPDWVSIDL
jgi:hypothetical protein